MDNKGLLCSVVGYRACGLLHAVVLIGMNKSSREIGWVRRECGVARTVLSQGTIETDRLLVEYAFVDQSPLCQMGEVCPQGGERELATQLTWPVVCWIAIILIQVKAVLSLYCRALLL